MLTQQEIMTILEEVRKAGVTTTDVTGLELVREDLSAILAIEAPVDTPLRNRLKRKDGNGTAHSWYKLVPTTYSEGVFLGTGPSGAFFGKGGVPTATKPSYKHVSAPYKCLGDIVEYSLYEREAGKSYSAVAEGQTKLKMKNCALIEEWCLINGDSSAGAGLQFDGLRTLIDGATWDNVEDAGGVALSLSIIKTANRKVDDRGGFAQVLILSSREKARFNTLILDYWGIRQNSQQALRELSAGFDVKTFDFGFGDVDITKSRYLKPGYGSMCDALLIDDKTILDDGNAVMCVDLMPLGAIPLPMVNTSFRTLIAEFSVLQMTSEAYQAKIINLKDTI